VALNPVTTNVAGYCHVSREVGENGLSRGIFRVTFSKNGDFETRFSAVQSKPKDRFSGFSRPPHSVTVHFHRPVRRLPREPSNIIVELEESLWPP